MEEELKKFELSLKEKREDSEKAYSLIESKKGDIVEILNKIASHKANIESFDVVFKNFEDRKTAVKDEIEAKRVELESLNKNIGEISEKLKQDRKSKEKLSLRMEEIKKAYFEIINQNDELKKLQNDITYEYNNKFSRKKALEDLEKSLEGYARSVKEVLSSGIKGVVGVVSKLIEVKAEYVVAIETAMGRSLQDIVVKTPEDAKACTPSPSKGLLLR